MACNYEKHTQDESSREQVLNPRYIAYWEGYDDRMEDEEFITIIIEALHKWGNEGIEKRFNRQDIDLWLKKQTRRD